MNTPDVPLDDLADLARAQVTRTLKKIPVLGAVSWLMLQASDTRNVLVSELEWRVLQPLLRDQAKLYLRGEAPVAYVSWALLSPESAARYRVAPHRLSAVDWNSGSEVWITDLIAPYGGARDVLEDLRKNLFAGQVIRQLVPLESKEARVIDWPALKPQPRAPADPRDNSTAPSPPQPHG